MQVTIPFVFTFKKVKINLEPGDVLLSHGEAPHYHRRYCVSLLSSAWNQVGPQCYGRQANFKIRKAYLKVFLFKLIQGLSLSPQNPLGVVWLSLTGN